ncbi:MAG: tetratricopeptide repeat protein [Sphingomicrobium sp.]
MKALLLSAAAVALIVPVSAAYSASLTLGGPLAANCYEAALDSGYRMLSFDVCTRALDEEPLTTQDRAATHVNRGILQMRRGQYAAAEADFNSAIALDADFAEGWLNKGFLELRRGNGAAAVPLIDRALAQGPRRRALAYFGRGLAHERSDNLRAAYADLVRARELEPGWSLTGEALDRYQVRGR